MTWKSWYTVKQTNQPTNQPFLWDVVAITFKIIYTQYSRIKRKNTQCVSTAKTMHILFHEQMVCRRGTKWKNAYLMSVVYIDMWLYHLLVGSERRSEKQLRMNFCDCYVTPSSTMGYYKFFYEGRNVHSWTLVGKTSFTDGYDMSSIFFGCILHLWSCNTFS